MSTFDPEVVLTFRVFTLNLQGFPNVSFFVLRGYEAIESGADIIETPHGNRLGRTDLNGRFVLLSRPQVIQCFTGPRRLWTVEEDNRRVIRSSLGLMLSEELPGIFGEPSVAGRGPSRAA